jgi:hypothetical protein
MTNETLAIITVAAIMQAEWDQKYPIMRTPETPPLEAHILERAKRFVSHTEAQLTPQWMPPMPNVP